MKKVLVALVVLSSVVVGCSSAGKKLDVEKNYKVVDRNPDPVPTWVDAIGEYQDAHKGNTYYIGDSGSVSERVAGCEEAKMRGNEKIAAEVSTYIESKVASFNGGQLRVDENNPNNPGMASHFAQLLKSKTMAMLHNVREDGHFWEKRQNKDNQQYYYQCQMLLRISDTDLAQLIRNASQAAPNLIENPEAKKEVMNALHDEDGSGFHHSSM
jgi:hypothetical protein